MTLCIWVIPRQIDLPLDMTLSDFDETVATCLLSQEKNIRQVDLRYFTRFPRNAIGASLKLDKTCVCFFGSISVVFDLQRSIKKRF